MTQPTVMQVSKDDNGTLYTTKLNEILSAHTSLFAGPSAPAKPVAFMVWQDTSIDPPREYRRNSTNTAWDDLGRRGTGQFYGNVTGSAASCDKLATARAIAISGAGTGSAMFDGSANATINLTLSNSGVSAGVYGSSTFIPVVTVNSKGLVTSVTQVEMSKVGLVESFNGRTGAVSLNTADVFAILPTKTGNGQKLLGLNSAGTGLEWVYHAETPKPPKVVNAVDTYTVVAEDHNELLLIQGANQVGQPLNIVFPPGLPSGLRFKLWCVGYPAGVRPRAGSGVTFTTDTTDSTRIAQNSVCEVTHLGNNLWDLPTLIA